MSNTCGDCDKYVQFFLQRKETFRKNTTKTKGVCIYLGFFVNPEDECLSFGFTPKSAVSVEILEADLAAKDAEIERLRDGWLEDKCCLMEGEVDCEEFCGRPARPNGVYCPAVLDAVGGKDEIAHLVEWCKDNDAEV